LGGQQPGLIFDTYFTSEQTLAAKPDIIDGFRTAMYEANAFATENPSEARAAVGKYTETDAAVLEKMTLPIWVDTATSPDGFETIVSLMEKYELMDRDKAPSYADLIHE
jgi:NitT/TauT family transport system substrate-binding protein